MDETNCLPWLHIFRNEVAPGDPCKCGQTKWDQPYFNLDEEFDRLSMELEAAIRRAQFKVIQGGKSDKKDVDPPPAS